MSGYPSPPKRGALLPLRLFLAAALLFALPAQPALAHGVYIFAWADGPRLCSESYFSKKSKVRGGEVRMEDADGALIASGVSDDAGLVCFDPPVAANDLNFVVTAGQGHKGTFLLPAADVADAVAAARALPAASEAQASASPAPEMAPAALFAAQAGKTTDSNGATLDATALEALIRSAVREELQRELGPLRKAFAAQGQEGPSAKDIAGGLGWIAGLAGFGALYAARRKKA